jgi:hypothetical protein
VLDSVDDQKFHWPSGRLQAQPELFSDGREDRWRFTRGIGTRTATRGQASAPLQVEVEKTCKPGAIYDGAIQRTAQLRRQGRKRLPYPTKRSARWRHRSAHSARHVSRWYGFSAVGGRRRQLRTYASLSVNDQRVDRLFTLFAVNC